MKKIFNFARVVTFAFLAVCFAAALVSCDKGRLDRARKGCRAC